MQAFSIHFSWKPLQPQHRGSSATVLLVGLMFLGALIWLRQHEAAKQTPARPLAVLGAAPDWSVPAGLQGKATAPRQGIETRK